MIPLKYNTASQEVPLGYFVDSTDGDTEETALTIANTDIKLWKSGATTLANKNSGGGTHISNGVYYAVLDATDTNTYGPMKIFVHVAGALPVILECLVMESDAYDALYAAAGTGGFELTAAATSAQLIDDVWDEVLTGATHNVPTSSGRRLRALQEFQGYDLGSVWIDTVNGSAGTTDYENGTVENPVDTIADANTIAASLGISRFQIAPGSTITLAATQSNQVFNGTEWTLALGGQSIAGSYFQGASVSGTGTGTNSHFVSCEIGTATLDSFRGGFCRFSGTLTFSEASDYYLHHCYSGIAGSGTPVIDFGAALGNTNLSMRSHSGGVTINNKDANGTDNMTLEGDGQLIVAASSSGAISLRGNFKVTNTGGATITYDDNTANIATRLPAALIGGRMNSDIEAINNDTTAADNLAKSALGIVPGACEGTPTTTVIQTDLSEATDDHYIGRVIVFTSGDAAGEASDITDYAGASGTVTITAITTAPSATDTFVIV